jgi:V8-like Glu-specific endopeptidase
MKFGSTAALSALLAAQILAAPVLAGEFSRGSKGSGEKPRGGVAVAPSLRDAKPDEMPKFDPDEARRALPMTESEIVRSMTARGITAGGQEIEVEPSEALRDLIRKEMAGGSRGSDEKQAPGPGRAEAQQGDRTVFGDDGRVQITNTEEDPFRMIGQILAQSSLGGSWTCSGALIGPRTVLTAAHCLYNYDSGGWSTSIQYLPGRRGSADTDAPFGAFEWETAFVVNGWLDNYDGTYGSVYPWDLGVLILKEPIGDDLGWFGYAHYDDLGYFTANIAGYPGDMPHGTMWFTSCDVAPENVGELYFLTSCDTFSGSSGSAVYAIDQDDERIIVGVNVAGSETANTAVRLNESYLDWVDNLVR